MKTAAVVAEYNPFHKGHEYQLEMTRKAGATHIVAVMSGNFVQRGEAAVYDKFLRARAAISCGADLVVELPLPWAMSGAQSFARGAVSVAKSLGCVDMLSFGCESSDLQKIKQLARTVYSAEYEKLISEYLKTEANFASARQMAAAKLLGEDTASLLESPNNILAVEYVAAAENMNCGFEFNAVTRMGDGYNSSVHSGSGFASATAVRQLIKQNSFNSSLVPRKAAELYTADYADEARLETAVLYALRRMSAEEIAQAPDISEGIENRIYSAIRKACSYNELFELIKTKRYPDARIRRILLSLFLGLKKEHSAGLPPYIRVLACGEKGREVLKAAKPLVPLVARASQVNGLDDSAKRIFELECKADDTHALCFSKPHECGIYFKTQVF